MDNERTVILENISDQSIGLSDTLNRIYRLAPGARMRISKVSLQDILDYPGSRVIFKEGMAQVDNITIEELYKMGLPEEEISIVLKNSKEQLQEIKEKETIIEKKEPVKKTTPAKKPAAKKTTAKTAGK